MRQYELESCMKAFATILYFEGNNHLSCYVCHFHPNCPLSALHLHSVVNIVLSSPEGIPHFRALSA